MSTHNFIPSSWYNAIGTAPPALTIADGDTIVTETIDAAGADRHGVTRTRGPNPMNGPIFVTGAEPGDALRVTIEAMRPIRDTGWTRHVLAANVVEPDFVRQMPASERVTWIIDRQAMTVRLADPPAELRDFVLPLAPMIGCFGVAPALGQAISTATSAEHGGNMDYRRFGPGTTVWLPVAVPGALFYLGDCHAVQGDGEIVGTGVETCFEVTVTLKVEKGMKLVWPRGETAEHIFTIGNARPLDQALQHATTGMLRWLESDYGLGTVAASHLMGQVVRYDVGNVYDPAYTMACRIAKNLLPPRR
jgi:acetamidase/formamidase